MDPAFKMVALVAEAIQEPVLTKKKKNKKRKLEEEQAPVPATETVLDENFNPDGKKKKKKKKNKENKEIETQDTAPALPTAVVSDEPVKKKKKKNKEKTTEATEDAEENKDSDESGDSEESGPFKKKFYTMSAVTEGVSKAEVKAYHKQHNITMYGKGRKKFKPLRSFPELGLSDAIMKITSGFTAPTPIQVRALLPRNAICLTLDSLQYSCVRLTFHCTVTVSLDQKLSKWLVVAAEKQTDTVF